MVGLAVSEFFSRKRRADICLAQQLQFFLAMGGAVRFQRRDYGLAVMRYRQDECLNRGDCGGCCKAGVI